MHQPPALLDWTCGQSAAHAAATNRLCCRAPLLNPHPPSQPRPTPLPVPPLAAQVPILIHPIGASSPVLTACGVVPNFIAENGTFRVVFNLGWDVDLFPDAFHAGFTATLKVRGLGGGDDRGEGQGVRLVGMWWWWAQGEGQGRGMFEQQSEDRGLQPVSAADGRPHLDHTTLHVSYAC